eukprot:4653213-Prymnesium_polylepis.1
MLRETDGTWDNGYTHAWTQVRAALSQATWDRASQGAPRLATVLDPGEIGTFPGTFLELAFG